jgi:hypothetical protein
MKRIKFFRGIPIFWLKGIYIFKLSIFVAKMEIFISFPELFYFQIHFGSGAARIRNDVFRIRILLKLSYQTGSGSGSTALPASALAPFIMPMTKKRCLRTAQKIHHHHQRFATWLSYGMKDMLTSTKDFKYLATSLAANSLNDLSGKAEIIVKIIKIRYHTK